MVHWQQLPIALYPDRLGTIFSGSAVVDAGNTTGFGTRGRPPLVAMYTYHDHLRENLGLRGFQSQGIAYSLDHGRNWTKYAGNPVLSDPTVRDFRDPKLFWHAATHRWIVVLAVADHIAFYSSPDLKHWTHESDFGQQWGSHQGVWECPDLIDMPVAGATARRQVLLVSIAKGGPNGGSATQYFIGQFDGHRFTLDADQPARLQASPLWLDYGTDDYAGSTWSGAAAGDDRVRFLGWMSNWQYATQVPTERWRSAMTLPRELRLVSSVRGLELHSLPVAELQSLRDRQTHLTAQPVTAALELDRSAAGNSGLRELDLDLDTAGATITELRFANSRGEATVFRINKTTQRYELDRRGSGVVAFSPEFASLQTAPLRDSGDRQRLQVFLDQASLEIFVNQGETVFTALLFPTVPYDRITLQADGAMTLREATIYQLKSIWTEADR
jgi:fructan beta-fructosidase